MMSADTAVFSPGFCIGEERRRSVAADFADEGAEFSDFETPKISVFSA
jgi:hypothetical protein